MDFLTKQPDELLVSVKVPALGARERATGSSAAAGRSISRCWALRPGDDGGETVKDARIVLGAVGSYPKLCTDAMGRAGGKSPTEEVLDEVARRLRSWESHGQHGIHDSWRKEMVPVHVRRTVQDCG